MTVKRLLAGISLMALSMSGARAQTNAGQSIDEIVVTATRRDQKVSDVPYNISAISGDSIAERNISDSNELLRTVPGVSVVDRGYRNSGTENGARIRGLNVDDGAVGDYAVASVSPLSTYVNDTPVFANFLLKDLARVEVLRGPQGTLYGSGSLGGTIRYIQNEPDPRAYGGSITVTTSHTENSSSAGLSGDMTVNIPLASNAAFRATVSHVDDPGWIDDPNLYKLDANGYPDLLNGRSGPDQSDFTSQKDANWARIWYEHASLLWQPNDDLKLVLHYTHQNDNVGGRAATTQGDNGFGQAYGPYDDGTVIKEPSHRDVQVESLEATYDLGFATLTSSTSYFDHRGSSVTDNTGFYGNTNYDKPYGFLYYFANYASNRLPLTIATSSYSDRADIEEVRLVSAEGHLLDYVAGLFYENEARGAVFQNFLPGFQAAYLTNPIYGASFVTGDRSFLYERAEKFSEKALFGELTYHLTGSVALTGGMRAFDDDTSVNAVIGGGVLAYNDVYTDNFSATHERRALGKGNLSWRIDPDTLAYATVSQGYRRGGSNAIPITGPQREDPSYLDFKSDSTVDYEVGLKGKFAGISYSLAAYDIDWSNVQVNTETPTWAYFAVVNGKSAVSRGLESEFDGHLLPQLHYSLGYAYNQSHLTSDIVGAGPTSTPGSVSLLALNGSPLPGVAAHTVNLSLDYTSTLSDDVSLISRISGYYQSSSLNALETEGAGSSLDVGLDPFFLFSASETLLFSDYQVTLFVKNMLNAKGASGMFTSAYSGSDVAANFFGNDSRRLITTPRTIGLSFNYSF